MMSRFQDQPMRDTTNESIRGRYGENGTPSPRYCATARLLIRLRLLLWSKLRTAK